MFYSVDIKRPLRIYKRQALQSGFHRINRVGFPMRRLQGSAPFHLCANPREKRYSAYMDLPESKNAGVPKSPARRFRRDM